MKLILGSSTGLIICGMIVLIPCLMVMDFFGANITDNYVENNSDYSSNYLSVVNKNIKSSNGYVSLSRVLYFYLENEQLSFDEIYNDNLDNDLKQVKPLSDVCTMEKYKYYNVCKSSEIDNSNQINEMQLKPFVSPIDFNRVTVTSYFMQERIVYGESDVHNAWDLAAPNETEVYSSCDGEVIKVQFPYTENTINKNDKVGGNHIKIKCEIDEDTSYILYYAHLYPNSSKVKVGDKVTADQIVAGVGTTGYSTGPHLHFQVQKEDGTNIDGMSLVDFTKNN